MRRNQQQLDALTCSSAYSKQVELRYGFLDVRQVREVTARLSRDFETFEGPAKMVCLSMRRSFKLSSVAVAGWGYYGPMASARSP